MLFNKLLILVFLFFLNILAFYIQYIFPYFSIIIIPLDLITKVIFIFIIIFYSIKNKIIKEKIEIDEYVNKNIAITITCYTESVKEIFNTIDSLVENVNFAKELNVKIFVIYDGQSKEKDTDTYTYDFIIDKMNILSENKNIKYNENWKNKEILIDIINTEYNGINIYHIIKQSNLGKTDSLTIVRDLLTNRLSDNLSNYFDCKDFHYVGSMDADCIMNEDGLLKLYKKIIQKDVMGISGSVFPKKDDKKRFWYYYQFSEYYTSQYLSRKSASYLGCVTCLPGAFNIIDLNYYTDEIRLNFLQHPDKSSLFRSIAVLVGEDKRFTSLLLYFNKGKKTIIDESVEIYTTVPNSIKKMISQRRRWVLSALVNLYYDMIGTNINFFIRLECLFNIITFFFYFFIYIFIYYTLFTLLHNRSLNIDNLIINMSFYCMITLIFFYKIFILLNIKGFKFKFIYFIGEIIMIFFNPIFKTIILIKCIITMDNFNWGNVKSNVLDEIEVITE